MISRRSIGKAFPPFTVEYPETLAQGFDGLFSSAGCSAPRRSSPPSNWPAVLALHGTACLLTIWEELGVDPLSVRLVAEEIRHVSELRFGQRITGRVTVEDVREHVEPDRGIEQRVDLAITFEDSALKRPVATYRCSFRVPIVPLADSH